MLSSEGKSNNAHGDGSKSGHDAVGTLSGEDNTDWSGRKLAATIFAVLSVPNTLLVGFGGSLVLLVASCCADGLRAGLPGLGASVSGLGKIKALARRSLVIVKYPSAALLLGLDVGNFGEFAHLVFDILSFFELIDSNVAFFSVLDLIFLELPEMASLANLVPEVDLSDVVARQGSGSSGSLAHP